MAEMSIHLDTDHMARAAADYIVTASQSAIAARGGFSIGLAGGSTPRVLYGLLATDAFASQIDWSRTHVFWGDERCVWPDHPESNYRMARETLLDQVSLPPCNIHRMRSELEPHEAAHEYEKTLQHFFANHSVAGEHGAGFDLILLGMGDDGHTASLFPGTQALYEQDRRAVANFVEKLGVWRITLTASFINAAATVLFLVAGASKAERLQQVLHDPYQPDLLPVQMVRPVHGRLVWIVDSAAASQLS